MARGDRRERIVFNDKDRATFVKTLGQVCVKTGWEVFAWVLMDNHYHIAVRTPKGNLVEGMTWFQNTFTRRINISSGLWGHLFGGRYKAVLVENREQSPNGLWSDYLTNLIDYIHLNPARAGLVDGKEKSVLDFKWSSLSTAYAVSPGKRHPWMKVAEGLSILGERDVVKGRKSYVQRLDEWALSEQGDRVGCIERDGQTLQSTLQRGWYWGSQEFKERILDQFGKASGEMAHRDNRSSQFSKDHAEMQALSIIKEACKHFGVEEERLRRTIRGDRKRAAVAWRIWRETTLPQRWLVEKLELSSPANVSHVIRRFDQLREDELEKEEVSWRQMSNHVA